MKDAEILENVYTNMSTFIEEWLYEGKDYELLQSRIANMLDDVEDDYKEMASNAVGDVADILIETVYNRK